MIKTKNILTKISEAGLVGRGGGAYRTAEKWAAVKNSLLNKKTGYIIANGAEGEPGVKKDGYILDNYPEEVINGVFLAYNFFGPKKIKNIYFFLNFDYGKKYSIKLKKILNQKKYKYFSEKVIFFIKPKKGTYISGEETTLLNILEGKRAVPRLRPPYPTEQGLFDSPTLINNIETFYNISLVNVGRYQEERFYTLNGALKNPGVYCLPASLTIEDVLRKTHNWPVNSFFVQVGGEASGEILNSEQLIHPVEGAGSITIYCKKKNNEKKLFKKWLKFYLQESCGYCSSCREGVYRLQEIINQKKINENLFYDLISNLEVSSFCALGSSLATPFVSYLHNIKKIIKN